jgi:hypothetical protein
MNECIVGMLVGWISEIYMGNESKIAIGLSAFALVISIVNMILTSPVLINLYSKPEISVEEINRELDGDTYRTMFIVSNDGSSSAKNVELIMNVNADDFIQTMQGFSGEVTEKSNGTVFKTVTLRASYLPPNDSFYIMITGSKEDLIEMSKSYNMEDGSPANVVVPAVVTLRSENSVGEVYRQPPWFQVNTK